MNHTHLSDNVEQNVLSESGDLARSDIQTDDTTEAAQIVDRSEQFDDEIVIPQTASPIIANQDQNKTEPSFRQNIEVLDETTDLSTTDGTVEAITEQNALDDLTSNSELLFRSSASVLGEKTEQVLDNTVAEQDTTEVVESSTLEATVVDSSDVQLVTRTNEEGNEIVAKEIEDDTKASDIVTQATLTQYRSEQLEDGPQDQGSEATTEIFTTDGERDASGTEEMVEEVSTESSVSNFIVKADDSSADESVNVEESTDEVTSIAPLKYRSEQLEEETQELQTVASVRGDGADDLVAIEELTESPVVMKDDLPAVEKNYR